MSDEQISERLIEEEMREAYMAYAMSVIVGRAIPRVEDGLKPVHRRILYAMLDLGMRYNSSYKKSARVVGEVLGKYHPHGDSAVYDALVRMVQDFSLRYPLIDGQGNFGNIDGDSAAAMRYTECRLHRLSEELLSDINKETVDWAENFDGSLKEPTVLPSIVPNLLVNGSSGIAVGMATNMPPHNLTEVADALTAYIDNPDITVPELMQLMPGPDFPTGGTILGRSGIHSAYTTGRGRVVVRGVIEREEDDTRLAITEIPYQVVKSSLIEEIADNVRDKRIEGISAIRDESDRKGMRIVLELKRGASADIVENQLYKRTRLQGTFGVNNLAIVKGEPKTLRLPDMLSHFLAHRTEVITRRTEYDLRKAEERAHILEGLLIALENLDEVIPLIRGSADAEIAKTALISNYELSEEQAGAILDMRLQRLTGLERGKIEDEHSELTTQIADFKDILAKPERVKDLIKQELSGLKEAYGDARRTTISEEEADVDVEDLIEPEDMVVTISSEGYIKRLSVDTYQAQRRGGVGIIGARTKEGDYIEHLFVANTHSWLLFFTDKGEVYWKKVYQIPEGSRTAKGTAIINLLDIDKDEHISAVIPVDDYPEDEYLMFITASGTVKKTPLSDYSRPRSGGIHAIKLVAGDDLVRVVRTSGSDEILLATAKGQSIRFSENDIRSTGRVSTGVRGIRLRQGDRVISGMLATEGATLLTVTAKGYGKRTPVSEYPVQGRGGYGVRNLKVSSRNGEAVNARMVADDDELLLLTERGIIIRTRADEISTIGRNTQGVRVMKLRDGDSLAAVAKVIQE